MARLYWNFDTDIKNEDLNDDFLKPYLDKLIFKTKEGNYLSISCNMDADYTLSDGAHDGRWKGLEYCVEDTEGNEITEWIDEDNSEDFIKLLDGAEPVGFSMDGLDDHCFSNDFVPTCENCDITIDIHGRKFEFHADKLFEEDDLFVEMDFCH